MPASPRISPSIRFNRFRQEVLISWRIGLIYPPRVYTSRGRRTTLAQTEETHGHHHAHGHGHVGCSGDHGAGDQPEAAPAIDPVCGMKVNRATAKQRFTYKDEEYLFCGARCRERFSAEPEKFLKPREPE